MVLPIDSQRTTSDRFAGGLDIDRLHQLLASRYSSDEPDEQQSEDFWFLIVRYSI